MKQKFLAFFSGFPDYRFPNEIGKKLSEELTCRKSLVFISAWPEDYSRNDEDSAGMYSMFKEYDIFFEHYYIIDNRMEAVQAQNLINEASCVFLMGGHPELQRKLLWDKGMDSAIYNAKAAILGVSAGSINMAKHSLDTKESPIPYEGLNLADITIKPHFSPENQEVLLTLLQISHQIPIYATEDNSAIFVINKNITFMGEIHRIIDGKLLPLT